MKRSSIKRLLKSISDICILCFGLLFINSKIDLFEVNEEQNLMNLFVVLYLILSVFFYRMELKDKDGIIQDLERKLNEKK